MNKLKVLGVVTIILGAGVSLMSDYVNKKELDTTIAEKIAEAVGKATENK